MVFLSTFFLNTSFTNAFCLESGNLLCTPHAATISALLISSDQVMDALRSNMSAQQQHGFEKINEIARDIVNAL